MSRVPAPVQLLTRAGRLLVLGSIAAVVAGAAAGVIELVGLGVIGLALVVACVGWVVARRPQLGVQRRVTPARTEVGARAHVELTIANRGRYSSPVATVHDPVTSTVGANLWLGSLRPGADATAAYRLPTERRGRFEIGPLEVTVSDPFGIAARTRTVGPATHATVLPHLEPISARVSGGGRDDQAGPPRSELAGQGDEFAGLRPYVRGDDLRRVHWRSSARSTDLLVRQDQPPAAGRLTVLADVRARSAGPAAQEHVVSAAASVLAAASKRGDAIRLLTSSGVDSDAATGARHLDRVLDVLALVEPDQSTDLGPAVTALTSHPADSLVVVTAGMDADDLVAVASAARQAVLVRFAPSSWTLGVGAGLAPTWDGKDARETDDRNMRGTPRMFALAVHVTAARPFPVAWRTAR